MKRTKRLIARPLRSAVRAIWYPLAGSLEALRGNCGQLVPPRRLLGSVGDGDFREVGEHLLVLLAALCELDPDDAVLDVGCGIGRVALPLTAYLSESGRYEGFDIVAEGIRWCAKHITPRFPNFRFQLADIFNKAYNPRGKYAAAEYRFPYADEAFDVVFLASVLTHMLPADVANYLREIARVMKRNGRCLATFFLLNPESLELMRQPSSTLNFRCQREGYRTVSDETPESAVAYDEAWVLSLCAQVGLAVREPIHFGSWCARPRPTSFQDAVIAVKQ